MMNQEGIGPTRWIRSDKAWELRNLDCPNYDECLCSAGAKGWSGFSCKPCKLFNKKKEIDNDRKEYTTYESTCIQWF
jgi:hypothetical protein